MKSFQVANTISSASERARYTDLQVLKSAAGWYIGTLHNAIEGWQEPGSRDSCYFASKETAEAALKSLELYVADTTRFEDVGEAVQTWENNLHANGHDPGCVGYRFTP
jgi:hypothetical protein